MKKRKKPIFLVTFLVIMITAVTIVNFPKDLLPRADNGANTGKDVSVPDKDSIGKGVSTAMGGAATRKPTPMRLPEGEDDGKPVIALTKPNISKPQPSESSTSTQWYSNETPKSFPKKN